MGFFDFFPYTNFHNVNLDWVLQRVKEWGELVEANNTAFHNLEEANASFKRYVETYLQNLDVQEEINIKMDSLLESGVLTEYLQPYVSEDVSAWLDEHITEPTGVVIDTSLTISGACADSKAVGDRFANYSGMSDTIKIALLSCFRHVLWDVEDGNYYNALKSSLYASDSRLTAIIDYGYSTVFADDPLAKIKWMLKVYYEGVEISPRDYTLTGSMIVGDNVLNVTYNGESTTVMVEAEENLPRRISFTAGELLKYDGLGNSTGVVSHKLPYLVESTNFRVYYTAKGHVPYFNVDNGVVVGIYPIPIPAWATHVKASVAPHSYEVALNCWRYNNSSFDYSLISGTETSFNAWNSETDVPQFENNARAMNVIIRKPSGRDAFDPSTEATEVVVQFT